MQYKRAEAHELSLASSQVRGYCASEVTTFWQEIIVVYCYYYYFFNITHFANISNFLKSYLVIVREFLDAWQPCLSVCDCCSSVGIVLMCIDT